MVHLQIQQSQSQIYVPAPQCLTLVCTPQNYFLSACSASSQVGEVSMLMHVNYRCQEFLFAGVGQRATMAQGRNLRARESRKLTLLRGLYPPGRSCRRLSSLCKPRATTDHPGVIPWRSWALTRRRPGSRAPATTKANKHYSGASIIAHKRGLARKHRPPESIVCMI